MKPIPNLSLLLLCFTIKGILSDPWDKIRPKNCGISRYLLQLPFDNTTSGLGQFPWIAKIGVKDGETGELTFFCTGTIIHPKFIITAGHCGEQGRVVRVGDFYLQADKDCDECSDCAPPFQESAIKSTFYVNHCRMTNLNDISLIMLENEIKFSEYVQPICLTRQMISHSDYTGKNVTVIGWGAPFSGMGRALYKDFSSINNMKFIETQIAPPDICNEKYLGQVEDSQFCVDYPTSVPDPCVIDSGSPLVEYKVEKKLRTGYLIGVASQNLTCDPSDLHPVIFTDASVYVSKFVDIMVQELQN